jgi:penicillin-binding protein A
VNRSISRIFFVGTLLFVALIVNLTYLQVIRADKLRDDPVNHRQIAEQMRIRRGSMLGYDGSVIAGSKRESGFYVRTYPHGALAPQIVGYNSFLYGRSGLEQSMNDYLTGEKTTLDVSSLKDKLLGKKQRGANVRLTIVPDVQKAAQDALLGQRGAIVALDPTTGAVIAAASAPSYDPATLEADWSKLIRDPASPLLSRTTQGLYPPGSAFKVVTATAGLESGDFTPQTVFDDTGTYVVYGGKVTNYHGAIFGQHTFTQALTDSVNTTFARVGVEVGKETMISTMQGFGFWQVPPLELPDGQTLASGRYRGGRLLPPDAKMDPLAVAWMSVGQERLLATPLQMALVAAAVANQGKVATPYLVQDVVEPAEKGDDAGSGTAPNVIFRAAPTTWTTAMDPQTAATLNTIMQQVVNAGTGTAAALQGIQVAGKTGTAEKGDSNVAWFIAFAPAAAPRVAVAVTVEDTAFTGGDVAAPLAAKVISAALAQAELP